jgi:release factor glutamine methyltransferase
VGVNIRTIKEIKLYLARELEGLYPEPEINALSGIILRTVLKSSGLHIPAFPETVVLQKQIRQITSICRELKTGKPLQYILGHTNFFNCMIRVNSDTMIPRPETEELVDLIIKENKGFRGAILDAGTGSGCIAIALAINLPGTTVTGIDISEGAILKAKENAILNNARVSFFRADLLNIDPSLFSGTDIIVSNPPYILESEKKHIARNVLDYEPHTALFVPDSDPLLYYSAIIKLAETALAPGGRVYFEINEAMGRQMSLLLKSAGYLSVETTRDLNGSDRIIKGMKHD